MRKLKLQMQLSIDGFVAGPEGQMDWMVTNWDDELKAYVKQITEPVDCIILGRKLAQGFIPFWAANPEAEGADIFNNTRKVVFTHTLDRSEWKNTTLARGNVVDEVAALKAQQGGDIIAYGGATFVSSLIERQLIDELHLFINPAAIGKGMPIFNAGSRSLFKLAGSQAFSCGIVVLRYEPARSNS
ncbi:dihydrofolate reductase family protein [Fulvivirgaceae bacterium PWU4]|uniref:Dihydrofolate reductase family protein n=1 Tax=Chryseosolibacter histidini TaxID=2782349 RepID=A0AAP2DN41_9BACT|nr:dihydrofolate reductase family protein [Chryseosolibacter histidini]MBT1697079.1 dihydrofolate reductase family protein [Chryseosolibacter histidini]